MVCDGRQLTGDEVGALLADWLLRRGVRGTYATSLVSGSLLHVLAGGARGAVRETLTGFKWIVRAGSAEAPWSSATRRRWATRCPRTWSATRTASPPRWPWRCSPPSSRPTGRTLTDRLDELAVEHGLFATGQLSVRVEDLALIAEAMAAAAGRPPAQLLGRPVASTDLALAEPPVDAVRLLGDGVRVVVRPSGTEPKLKAYLEVVVPVPATPGCRPPAAAGADELDRLRAEMSTALGLCHPRDRRRLAAAGLQGALRGGQHPDDVPPEGGVARVGAAGQGGGLQLGDRDLVGLHRDAPLGEEHEAAGVPVHPDLDAGRQSRRGRGDGDRAGAAVGRGEDQVHGVALARAGLHRGDRAERGHQQRQRVRADVPQGAVLPPPGGVSNGEPASDPSQGPSRRPAWSGRPAPARWRSPSGSGW